MTQQELIQQAQGIANSIGYEIKKSVTKSDDPFLGYDYTDLTYLVGKKAVDSFRSKWDADAMVNLKGQEITIGQPVVATRGKMKGIKGWVNAEMPSQYNEGELAYLVINLQGVSGWVAKKSLKLRLPDIGERDLQVIDKARGEKVKKWSRGQRVKDDEGRLGCLVGFGKQSESQPVPTVAVQWEGASQEEWVIASMLGKV